MDKRLKYDPNAMNTGMFEIKIGQCENQEEYEELVRENQKLFAGWRDYIFPLMRKKKLTAKSIAEGCRISEASAATFSRKIPAKRENVIMLAMMMGLSVEDTNYILTRWAKYQKLYAKNAEDVIWIYLLKKGQNSHPADTYDEYYHVYKRVHQEYLQEKSKGENEKETFFSTDLAYHSIDRAVGAGSTADSRDKDTQFIGLIKSLLPAFESGYQELMDYINAFFRDSSAEDELVTPNAKFQDSQFFLNRYYQKMRKLKEEHKLPSRGFLISLGLRLSMDVDELNKMLELAGMSGLCPKDRLEGSLIFYLEELFCQFPSFFVHPKKLQVSKEYDELRDYEADDTVLQAQIEEYSSDLESGIDQSFELCDFDYLTEEKLVDYIGRRLQETNIFSSDDKSALKQLLKQLM